MALRDEKLSDGLSAFAAEAIAGRFTPYIAEKYLSDIRLMITQDPHITYAQIATRLASLDSSIADSLTRSDRVIREAVGNVVRMYCTDIMDQREVYAEKNLRAGKDRMQQMREDGTFHAHQSDAGKAVAAKRERDGVLGDHMDRMRKTQGVIVWEQAEKERLVELLNDPNFLSQSPNNRGKTDLSLIADQLNREFHDGQAIRNSKSVHNARYSIQHPQRRR